MKLALVGNRNCGKSTLFNRLTGGNAHVGNFPGVTVERKTGTVLGHEDWEIVDLPGVCSLHPSSPDEAVTRDFLLYERPDVIINAADATALERGLYLSLQLTQLGIPTVLALNMSDELRAGGGSVDERSLSAALGLPVVSVSAQLGHGLDELLEQCASVQQYSQSQPIHSFPAVESCLHALEDIVDPAAGHTGIPASFAASCLLVGDRDIVSRLELGTGASVRAGQLIADMERELGHDGAEALVTSRYAIVDRLCRDYVKQPDQSRTDRLTLSADRLLAGGAAATPIFVCVMLGIFYLSFGLAGGFSAHVFGPALDALFSRADVAMLRLGVHPLVRSLVSDGIFAGIGSVLRFLPVIFALLFMLSLLEQCGYLARITFIADRPFSRLGLSGACVVPLLLGFGCTVPAVTAARTLPDARERLAAATLTPFMSCSAKLPVYSLFAAAFFPRGRAAVIFALYLLGILSMVLLSPFLRRTPPNAEALGLIMELPRYRLPSPRDTLHLVREKSTDFLRRTFTLILLASIAVWFMSSFDSQLRPVSTPEQSLLDDVGGFISPLFAPLGFGDWRVCTALIAGLLAKEAVVGTLGVLLGAAGLGSVFTPCSALSFLVFVLLYTPCAAALSCLHRETGSALKTAGIALFHLVLAWLCAAVTYTFAVWFT